MTPLGHAGISLLTGIGITKMAPGLDATTILTGTVIGGTALDLDLIYKAIQKKSLDFLDKRIGLHRYLPTHAPFFVILLFLISLFISTFTNPAIAVWEFFFAIGAMLHLFLDTLFFPEGINFTYPFNRKMVRLFTIKTHKFWAKKPIAGVKNWHINYLAPPLFWVSEVVPAIFVFMLLWQTLR